MEILYFILFLLNSSVLAENGLKAWLRYAPLACMTPNDSLPTRIVTLNETDHGPLLSAKQELQTGFHSIFGTKLEVRKTFTTEASTIVIGTLASYNAISGRKTLHLDLVQDGFWLSVKNNSIQILGQNERGALYGAFEYLSMLAQGNFSNVAYSTNPSAPIRWTNEWDNMDGSIERGFAGKSIFFSENRIISNLTRAAEYARLLASVRINAVVVNNVNANYITLTNENIEGLGAIADVFRPYGVQLGLSVYFASPANLTSLGTYDPIDPRVIDWWHKKTSEIYNRIPDMAGYLVKANSEGQPGPLVYNRTLAEGANTLARALKPHGGILMFRAFVYDYQHLDEGDWKADRARAAVDILKPLDEDFDDNVVVQIKYGPIDFQVREPVSPLFANLRKTSTAIELQVTQEYLGQQCHHVYLPLLWRTITHFDLRIDNSPSLTKDVFTGKHFKRKLGGACAVVNVGQNSTWLGSHLAMSNLYAYGRLAWNWDEDAQDILHDWIRLTFGQHPKVINTISNISMESWSTYEKYTGNLGIQTLTDILYTHFGPNPGSQDGNHWGQWTRADSDSIGMDRTTSNGTGFSKQYPPQVFRMYENIKTTPEDLLLWFHHVPYSYRLRSGKTVIQHFYDAHYEGAESAHAFLVQWEKLKGLIDHERYNHVLFRQQFQAAHSIIWRDAVNSFYYNLSQTQDILGRVGKHPYRIEAENMHLNGYMPYIVHPIGVASNRTAVITTTNSTTGTISTVLNFASGLYDLAVNYYDIYGGNSTYSLLINGELIGEWSANIVDQGLLGHTPSIYLDGHSATRITFKQIFINCRDNLEIIGRPSGIEPAPLDYIALLPLGVVD